MSRKLKIVLTGLALALMSASCNPFGNDIAAGVVKTSNGGADWQLANNIKDQPNASLANFSISRLSFDPTNMERIIAGTYNDGIYISNDGGNSWENILSRLSVYDFAVHPNDAATIYAAGVFDKRGRVLKTSDGGKSWVEVFNEASSQNPVRSIALNPNNPQEVVIGLAYGSLIYSHDSGQSWRLLQNYNDRINRLYWTNQGLYAIVRNAGIFRSVDSGGSFQNVTSPLLSSGNAVGQLISSGGIATFSQVALNDNAPGLIYMATSSGLFRSTDSGNTWQFIALPLRQRDLPVSAVSVAPGNSNVVYASAGSNIYKSNDGGGTWQAQDAHPGGLINALLIHPQLPQIAYAGVYAP